MTEGEAKMLQTCYLKPSCRVLADLVSRTENFALYRTKSDFLVHYSDQHCIEQYRAYIIDPNLDSLTCVKVDVANFITN